MLTLPGLALIIPDIATTNLLLGQNLYQHTIHYRTIPIVGGSETEKQGCLKMIDVVLLWLIDINLMHSTMIFLTL